MPYIFIIKLKFFANVVIIFSCPYDTFCRSIMAVMVKTVLNNSAYIFVLIQITAVRIKITNIRSYQH
jgi:hypothetical protein